MEPCEFSDEPSVSWALYFAAFAAVVEKAPPTGVVDLTEQVCHLNAITHGFGYSDHVSLFFTATKALKLPGTSCDADFKPLKDLASVATQLAVPASGADEHAGRIGLYFAAFYAAVECFIVAPRSELHTQAFTDLKALCSTRVAPFLTTQLRQRVVTPEAVHDSVKRFSMFDETISDSSSRSRWLAKQCSQLLGIRTALEASDSPYGASSNAAPPQEARPKQPSPLPPQVASPTNAPPSRYPLQPVANSSGVKRGELTSSSSLSTPVTPSPPTLAPAKPVYRPTVAKQGGFLVVSRPPNLLAPKPLLTSPLSSTPTSGPKLQQQLDVADISFATPQAQLPSMPSIVQGTPLAQAGVGSFLPPRILAARSPSPPRRGHR